MKNKIPEELLDILKRIIKKKNDLDKIPHEFGTGITLFQAEIQLVSLINLNEGKSVTEIAKLHNVTKGAISQTLKKVVDKGLVLKNTDPGNISRTLLYLTKKGKNALLNYEKWHNQINTGFNEYVDNIDNKQYSTIKDFLLKFESLIDKHTE